MAECKFCGKSGLFFKVDQNGLCPKCAPQVTYAVVTLVDELNRYVLWLQQSVSARDADQLFQQIMRIATQLYEYEKKGIPTLNPSPSSYLRDKDKEWDRYISIGLEREFDRLLKAVFDLKTPKAKIKRIEKFATIVSEYKQKMTDPSSVSKVEQKIEKLLKQTENELVVKKS